MTEKWGYLLPFCPHPKCGFFKKPSHFIIQLTKCSVGERFVGVHLEIFWLASTKNTEFSNTFPKKQYHLCNRTKSFQSSSPARSALTPVTSLNSSKKTTKSTEALRTLIPRYQDVAFLHQLAKILA